MREPWRERLALWVCAHFGHRPHGERTPIGGYQFCRRCHRIAKEGS